VEELVVLASAGRVDVEDVVVFSFVPEHATKRENDMVNAIRHLVVPIIPLSTIATVSYGGRIPMVYRPIQRLGRPIRTQRTLFPLSIDQSGRLMVVVQKEKRPLQLIAVDSRSRIVR
jgi:hypothetical protein